MREQLRKVTLWAAVAVSSSMTLVSVAAAEPCLVVYPSGPTVYHYDVNEYYTVGYGDPLYDPLFDRGGAVLIDIITDEIPLDIYQVPNLLGFTPSMNGEEGFFFNGSQFELVIDGFENQPTTYQNILLVFDPDPGMCAPTITVDGMPVTGDTYPIGSLTVSTPTRHGNNYSDTVTKQIAWSGCHGVRMWAFADENYNGVRDGGECFTAFSHDLTVPTQETSWGVIKSLYE
jgi:hypothetical protein